MAQRNASSSVYKSLGQVWKTLAGHTGTPEVDSLLKLCVDKGLVRDASGQTQPLLESVNSIPRETLYPFLVIEGLDGTGKTTLTRFLGSKLKMRAMSTPPNDYEEFMKARGYFDLQPESIRRAYYSLGNYIASMDVLATPQAVVMDRYWHSTAAYAVAHEMKSGVITDFSGFDLSWPSDLLKPDLVIFLQVSEKERLRRHSTRKAFTNTEEEQTLAADITFRQNLVQVYKSIAGPHFTEIEIEGEQAESQKKILKTVLEVFPNLKENVVSSPVKI